MAARIGFAVIYRWRLKPGKEDQFRQGWERATVLLMRERGALGSRLHKADDGTWVAYAQWPSKSAWETSRSLPSVDPGASQMMKDAIIESWEPVLLTPLIDHLQPGQLLAE